MEDLIDDYRLGVELALQQIFEPAACEEFCFDGDGRVISRVNMYIRKKAAAQGREPCQTPEEALRLYGIRTPGRLALLSRWIRNTLSNVMTGRRPVDHLKNVHGLVRFWYENNPNGGYGCDVATRLDRYISLSLFYDILPNNNGDLDILPNNNGDLIGGNRKTLRIPHGSSHKSTPLPISLSFQGQNSDVTITFHQVKGSAVVSPGDGPVRERVNMRLLQDIVPSKDGYIDLFHGTDIASATLIAKNGPDVLFGSYNADFGQAFYVTDEISYALHMAQQGSAHSSNSNPAVLLFRIQHSRLKELLEEYPFLDLRGSDRLKDWENVVKQGCRSRSTIINDDWQLGRLYEDASCVAGPITKNFQHIHCGATKPLPLVVNDNLDDTSPVQWAFKDVFLVGDVFRGAFESDNVHVFRFYN